MSKRKNIIAVIVFAIAMAYLESAVVVYLRAMYGIEDLLRDLNFEPDIYTLIEIGREAATLIMLAVTGFIAGSDLSKRIGFFLLAFGVWDIFYYIWLYVFIKWPATLLEWDILFLIPLPWWGPVITPILISLLFIFTGCFLISEVGFKITSIDWTLVGLSIILILYTFMEDSVKIIISGTGYLTKVRPDSFNWILFLTGYISWVGTAIKIFLINKKT